MIVPHGQYLNESNELHSFRMDKLI
jgi:hypothetical protein